MKTKLRAIVMISMTLVMTFIFTPSFASTIYLNTGDVTRTDWSSDFQTIIDGTWENMSRGLNPANIGTTYFDLWDMISWDFGTVGNRLEFIYTVEGTNPLISLEQSIEGTVYRHYTNFSNPDIYDYKGYRFGVGGISAYFGRADRLETEQWVSDWKEKIPHTVTFTATDSQPTSLTAFMGVAQNQIPEPSTIVLFGMGILSIARMTREKSV